MGYQGFNNSNQSSGASTLVNSGFGPTAAGDCFFIAGAYSAASTATLSIVSDKGDVAVFQPIKGVMTPAVDANNIKKYFVAMITSLTAGSTSVTATWTGTAPSVSDMGTWWVSGISSPVGLDQTAINFVTTNSTATSIGSGLTGNLLTADSFCLGFGWSTNSYDNVDNSQPGETGWLAIAASSTGAGYVFTEFDSVGSGPQQAGLLSSAIGFSGILCATFCQNGAGGGGVVVSLAARVSLALTAKASPIGVVPLSALMRSQIKAAPTLKPTVALSAATRLSNRARAAGLLVTALSARTSTALRTNASVGGHVALSAATFTSLRTKAAATGKVALSAATRLALSSQARLTGQVQLVALVGNIKTMVTTKAALTLTTSLAVSAQMLLKTSISALANIYSFLPQRTGNTSAENRIGQTTAENRIGVVSAENRTATTIAEHVEEA
jgi:hypothetical protein